MSKTNNTANSEALKPSSREDFLKYLKVKQEGTPFLLKKSNLVVKITAPDIVDFLIGDYLPQDLVAEVLEIFSKQEESKEADSDMNPEMFKKFMEMKPFINAFFQHAVVYPRFVQNPQSEDEFPLDVIPFLDRLSVFGEINKGLDLLKTFR